VAGADNAPTVFGIVADPVVPASTSEYVPVYSRLCVHCVGRDPPPALIDQTLVLNGAPFAVVVLAPVAGLLLWSSLQKTSTSWKAGCSRRLPTSSPLPDCKLRSEKTCKSRPARIHVCRPFGLSLPFRRRKFNGLNCLNRQHIHALYVKDDWRVTPKLTLNLGLRWEFATPIWERDNLWSNFDPGTNTLIRATSGSLYNRALVNPDYKDFGPRLGFA